MTMTLPQQSPRSPLYRRLEEEYETRHGRLPRDYVEAKERLVDLLKNEDELNEALVTELYQYMEMPLAQILEEEYRALGLLPARYAQVKKKIQRDISDKDAVNEALVSELYKHDDHRQPAALCLSGGGIRSATFGLGVLQGLARRGLLEQFHYLSTVSGGGYVGSWLTSWIHRKGLTAVLAELSQPPQSKLNPEPDPIRHLRDYSNYLTPQLGLLSADTWTVIATYLRNLFVNWFVWLPLLLVALLVPRLIVAIAMHSPHDRLWSVAMILGAGFIPTIMALAYIGLNLPSVRDAVGNYDHWFQSREHQGGFLVWCLVPLLISAFLLTTAWAWLRNSGRTLFDEIPFGHDLPTWAPLVMFVAIGVGVHLLGWVAALGLLIRVGGRQRIHESRKAIDRFWGEYHYTEILAIVISGAVGGVATWILATQIFPNPSGETSVDYYACFAAPLLLFSFLIAGAVYVGLASRWTSDDDREWWARSSGWILIALVAWMAMGTIVIFGPVLLLGIPKVLVPLGGVTGLLTLLLGFSGRTEATSGQADMKNWQAALLRIAPVLAAPVALILLAAFLALLTGWMIQALPAMVSIQPDDHHTGSLPGFLDPDNHRLVLHHANGWLLTVFAGVLILFAVPMGWLINVNKFSLHSVYRNRLIRAYLGASNEQRHPHPFTGFDPMDNIEMYRLAPTAASGTSGPRLLHVVNIALNLVGKRKEKLAWQERKAKSLTVSPLHAGNWQLGYRRAEDYGQNKSGRAISLGTAISISGAAASPNMGYHSSPAVTFLMTLFNARLGWWLGNPGKAGQSTYCRSSPSFSILPMIQEAFGFTNDENPYVYLSDGGHFENLGLYEMVLRHCRFILAVDSGRDPECAFDDLGNAIRKVRIDLGIPITLQKVRIYPRNGASRKPDDLPKYCAVGSIGYSRLDPQEPNGILIYIKPALCEDEPIDIYNYARTSAGFPHESTNDQWFSESQFESYRMLGSHIIDQLCGEDWQQHAETWTGSALDLFHAQVRKYQALGARSMSAADGKAALEAMPVRSGNV
jgi:hypothetical protein